MESTSCRADNTTQIRLNRRMNMPKRLDELPTEILCSIGHQLERKDLVTLALVNKLLHSSLLPVLFSRIEIRHWVSGRALKALNIEPLTWNHVRDLDITVNLEDGYDELWHYRPPTAFRPGDNLWRSYFCLLPPLRKLVVNILAGTLSPQNASRVLESPFWQRFLNLLSQKHSSTGLLQASSLDVHLPPAEHLPPSSEVWPLLKEPFNKYKNVSVYLTLSKAFVAPADDAEQLLRVFTCEWVQEMHFSVSSVSSLQVATTFQTIASLEICFSNSDRFRDFWTFIGKAKSTLQSLTIHKAEKILFALPPKKMTMKNLKYLEIAGGHPVPLIRGISQVVHMPELKRIKLAFDLTCGGTLATILRADLTTILLDTEALGRLASSLPPHCFRAYIVKIAGTAHQWAQHAHNLEPLFNAEILQIDATIVNNASATGSSPQFYSSDLETAFGAGLPSVTNLGIRVLSDTESDSTRWNNRLDFAGLTSLTIDFQNINKEWSSGWFILTMILDRLRAPLLVSLTFQDTSHEQLMNRHATVLICYIPSFTRLKQVSLKSGARTEVKLSAIKELRKLCAGKRITFSSTALWLGVLVESLSNGFS